MKWIVIPVSKTRKWSYDALTQGSKRVRCYKLSFVKTWSTPVQCLLRKLPGDICKNSFFVFLIFLCDDLIHSATASYGKTSTNVLIITLWGWALVVVNCSPKITISCRHIDILPKRLHKYIEGYQRSHCDSYWKMTPTIHFSSGWFEDVCARSTHQGHRQVITDICNY